MIVYSLACVRGHSFEGWFKDSAAYDEQAADGKLVCPVCNSRKVQKAPMAPALSGTKNRGARSVEDLHQMRQFVSGLRKYVQDNAENVGRQFPEEVRKIHYGEAKERPIYGEASVAEAKELVEEGIEVAPLPPDLDEASN